jgi:hypothetical protein
MMSRQRRSFGRSALDKFRIDRSHAAQLYRETTGKFSEGRYLIVRLVQRTSTVLRCSATWKISLCPFAIGSRYLRSRWFYPRF